MTISHPLHVELLHDEIVAVLRSNRENERLHPASKIVLASILFADSEGVAHLNDNSLRRWCAEPGHQRASKPYLQRQINGLIEAGVLAPGSTPTELRSMLAHRVERVPVGVEEDNEAPLRSLELEQADGEAA